MKRVLIITYYWPPAGGGGVQRWLKFVKYLPEYGWEPVVYTPENPEVPVLDESLEKEVPKGVAVIRQRIWEPYSAYKLFTGKKERIQTAFLKEEQSRRRYLEGLSIWVRGNLFIPDARRFWIKPSVRFLAHYLGQHPVDAIVSTGPPHSMHLIGQKVSRKTGIPWVADFRDPWTNIDFYGQLRLGKRADRKHHHLEEEVLREAQAVTVVSPGMADEFRNKVTRDYPVIPNGFDAKDLEGLEKITPEPNRFVIAHIGSMTPSRNPRNLWKVLRSLCNENDSFSKQLKIRIIGKMDQAVAGGLKESGLESRVENQPYLPHNEVVVAQRRAHVLLLVVNDTPNAKLILTGKLFEYLAARRPIVCIGPRNGDAAAVLRETGSGMTFGFDETGPLKDHILSLYLASTKGKGSIKEGDISQYERRNLTRKMAQVLNSYTVSPQGSGSRNS